MNIRGLVLCALIAMTFSSEPFAQTLRVGSGCTYTTIQDAVDAVASGGSATLLARNQTFNESVTIVNKSITLIGGYSSCTAGSSTGISTLDASGTSSPALNLFASSGSRSLRVERFDLTNGTGVVAPFVPFPAGGLNVWTDSSASSNTIVDNVWIFQNSTEFDGGGVAFHGNGSGIATFRNGSRIYQNTVTGDDARGGGLFCQGSHAIVIRGGRIHSNAAGSSSDANGRGGGLYLDGCSLSWFAHPANGATTGSGSLDNNAAFGYGGGIYATGGADVFLRGAHDGAPAASTAPLIIRDNDALDDGAAGIIGFGGAVYATGSGTTVTADRTWIYNHSVPRNGGAFHVSDGAEVTIERSTELCHDGRLCSRLFDNAASGVGGALYVRDAASKATVRRTILADNSGQPFYIADGGTLEMTDSVVHGNAGTDHTFTTWASSSSAPITTVRIRRSTIADTNPDFAVFRLVGDPANLLIYDSIVHERNAAEVATVVTGNPSTTFNCILWHSAPTGMSSVNTTVGDPMFVDRDQDRYYLSRNSRAINYCNAVPPPPGVDLEWNPRGIVQDQPSPLHGPYDLGAYEIDDGLFQDRFED